MTKSERGTVAVRIVSSGSIKLTAKSKVPSAEDKTTTTPTLNAKKDSEAITSTTKTVAKKAKDTKTNSIKPKNTKTEKKPVKDTKNDSNEQEQSPREIGQKAKRANDTKKNDKIPQKKKKENETQKGKDKGKKKETESTQKELRIIDDPNNYLPRSLEEEFDEEYEVESIVNHKVYRGKVVNYSIKWKGWDNYTEEMASTIHDDVPELCRIYWKKVNPYPVPSNVVEFIKDDTVVNILPQIEYRKKSYSHKHIRTRMAMNGFVFSTKWPTENTNWEVEMKKIIAVLPSALDGKLLFAYIEWLNGQRTVHLITELHKRCPQKLLEYYEERLRIF